MKNTYKFKCKNRINRRLSLTLYRNIMKLGWLSALFSTVVITQCIKKHNKKTVIVMWVDNTSQSKHGDFDMNKLLNVSL